MGGRAAQRPRPGSARPDRIRRARIRNAQTASILYEGLRSLLTPHLLVRLAFVLVVLLAGCAEPEPEGAETIVAEQSDLSSLRPSQVHVTRSTGHYLLRGTSARALYDEMRERGPRGNATARDATAHFGRTAWQGRWELTYAETADRCRLRRVDVYLDVEQTLPRWQPDGRVTDTLTQQWDAFIRALRRHENAHGALAEQSGHAILEDLGGLEAPTCETLKDEARTRARAALRRGIEANERFDARTQHGATEGVRWPPR